MGRYYYIFNYNYSKHTDFFKRKQRVESEGNLDLLHKKYKDIMEEMERKKTMWLAEHNCVCQENGWVKINNDMMGDAPPMRADFDYVKPIEKYCKICDERVMDLGKHCPCNGNKDWKKDTQETLALLLGNGDYDIINKKTGNFIIRG
tara:strand:+ start:220 stop:660 length:441 start_codon:yes stop_codon:yes gene_type:complete